MIDQEVFPAIGVEMHCNTESLPRHVSRSGAWTEIGFECSSTPVKLHRQIVRSLDEWRECRSTMFLEIIGNFSLGDYEILLTCLDEGYFVL
ncbi:hypothetical protein EVAR_76916_1 [Eumeta japonica]|uniref:Uncharacterized protein n=1 Tax=Eumeta variegata TaxID=151549 RepID=A0A4C1SHI3_EUMVA|nr:hypothetical protein EVAR_76916_1 [Eumeta japonica]